MRKSHVKKIAFSEIFIMILAIFAFAFVLSEASFVKAENYITKNNGGMNYRYGEVSKIVQVSMGSVKGVEQWKDAGITIEAFNKFTPGLLMSTATSYLTEKQCNAKGGSCGFTPGECTTSGGSTSGMCGSYSYCCIKTTSTGNAALKSNAQGPADGTGLFNVITHAVAGSYTAEGKTVTLTQEFAGLKAGTKLIGQKVKEDGTSTLTYLDAKGKEATQVLDVKQTTELNPLLKQESSSNLLTVVTKIPAGKYSLPAGTVTLKENFGTLKAGTEVTGFEVDKNEASKISYKDGTETKTVDLNAAQTKDFIDKTGIKPKAPAVALQGWGDALIAGITYAGIVYGLVTMIGPGAGLTGAQTTAWANALGLGVMAGELSTAIPGVTSWGAFGIGALFTVAMLIATLKDTKKWVITFTCSPWQAPSGGADCGTCNNNPFEPCSEYRCRSLGLACELLNKEAPGKEMCAWVNPKDTLSPKISPVKEFLSSNDPALTLNYINDTSVRPPALGVRIVKNTNSCLPPFTALQFGINTEEPAQCRLDYNHTAKFDQMQFYFGDNYYALNHTLKMRLPGYDTFATNASEESSGSPIFENDGTTQLLVRCRDRNGNENADEYSIKFCVDPSPDTTPPIIEGTSILSGRPVAFGTLNTSIEVYVNERSECRWSIESKAYQDMENSMGCGILPSIINAVPTYVCIANLTGLKSINKEENKFYFRCKDHPEKNENERNVMVQSYNYVLKGSQPLNIIKVGPNETVTGGTSAVTVNLELETANGAEEGKALCFFSPFGTNGSYTQMFETNNYVHKQKLQLTPDFYNYYFRCTDLGGNSVEANTSFTVFSDTSPPGVARVYREAAVGLKIVTDEDAECVYSLTECNFEFETGLHAAYTNPSIKSNSYLEWKPNTVYYVKCRDLYGNEPNPGECSMIIKPVESARASS